jgi:hypothetical protein
MTSDRRRFVSVSVFAARTGTPVSTVRHRCERGAYGATKPKGRWRIPVRALNKTLRAKEQT